MTSPPPAEVSAAPQRPGVVLASLILVAGVANLNLAVANVALPDIGKAFDAGQTELNLVAVGYSLGLAASVLYLGALGDRYGRKRMLVGGMALSIPACLLAALAPSIGVLFVARVIGGLAAGMAFPTTLALITALWSGPGRTKSIALWSGIGGAIAALGPLISGALLEQFDWESVFVITLPLAVLALLMALRYVPSHVNETTDPVDNLGGIMSVVLVAALVLSINFAPVPNKGALALGLGAIALAALVAFFIRQRRAANPLYDLGIAGRRIFWVAACGGVIVFGSLMAAMFVGQQFLQNVLGYSTLGAGAAILPAALLMVLVAPRSAKIVEERGSRFTLLAGYFFCLLGFLTMLLLWKESIPYWKVALGYALIGIGVGLAGTPASRSLTGSVPVTRAGMASGTADLQRDLGGAIMQSIFGALLTAGYASAVGGGDRRGAERLKGHRQRPEPTHQVLRGRRGCRATVPPVLEHHHRRREVVVPSGRRVGLHRRHRCDPARRGDRLLPLPAQGAGGATAPAVPRAGRSAARTRVTFLSLERDEDILQAARGQRGAVDSAGGRSYGIRAPAPAGGDGPPVGRHELIDRGAALTYYAVLALVPGFLVLFSVIGLFGDQDTINEVLKILRDVGPSDGEAAARQPLEDLVRNDTQSGALLGVGVIAVLWTASAFVGSFFRASATIWGVERRAAWRAWPLRMALTVVVLILLAVALLLIALTGELAKAIGDAFGIGDEVLDIYGFVKWPVLLAVVVVLVGLLYRSSPSGERSATKWLVLTPGGGAAVVAWMLVSVGFEIYVNAFASYDTTYGALGTTIAGLVWLWLTNLTLLMGVELDAAIEYRSSKALRPTPKTADPPAAP